MEDRSEEVPESQTDTVPPPSGPSGLIIFGRLLQKHSYVSALIIMMVKYIQQFTVQVSVIYMTAATRLVNSRDISAAVGRKPVVVTEF